MVITGASRSVAVKLFYDLGFQNPLFVTILYLTGQALSLIVYLVSRRDINGVSCCWTAPSQDYKILNTAVFSGNGDNPGESDEPENSDKIEVSIELQTQNAVKAKDGNDEEKTSESSLSDECQMSQMEYNMTVEAGERGGDGLTTNRPRSGSATGLTIESHNAATVTWVHVIPWYLKPAIPGFFNLCNSAMRWGSLIYVAASMAEMLISGLELLLSVVAARCIRKRLISPSRWVGVFVVAIGLVLVRLSNSNSVEEEAVVVDQKQQAGDEIISSKSHNAMIGDVLIIGQCVMSVIQDMTEELFMHESEFPATLLLGMEGLFGLLFGIPLYLYFAPRFAESPSATWETIASSPSKAGSMVGLTLLFTITGIFNIMATGVTSSMTRNVWKNFRTVLVWAFGLVLFYSTQNEDLGEEWIYPNSVFVLFSFSVMLSGAYIYYTQT